MLKNILTSVFLCFFVVGTVTAQADERVVGNGGHLVVCKNSAGRVSSTDVLDGYEARHMGTIDLGDAKLSVEAKVELVLARLSKINIGLANDLRLRAKDFFQTASFYPDMALPESLDEGQVILSDGCSLHQFAIQQASPLPGGKFYIVNDRFWQMVTSVDRAVLVLHEVLYSYFRDKGAQNSQQARLLNAMLIQNKLSQLSSAKFSKLLQRMIAASKSQHAPLAMTSAVAPAPLGSSFVTLLNESYFKASSAQSTTLADDQKCFVTAKTKLAIEILEAPNAAHVDHFKVKLKQLIRGCDFGVEGSVGYLFANHIQSQN